MDAAGTTPRRSAVVRWLAGTAIVAAAGFWLLFTVRLVASLAPGDVPVALLGALLGALAADGLTGLVHWACDTWGDERTPWLGPTLIFAFREHHADPLAMLDSDWATTNREAGFTAAIVLGVLCLTPAGALLDGQVLAAAFLSGLALYGAPANQLHLWAHDPRRPRWVGWAQRRGLVLSPARHARHHRAPHTGSYCISTGWLDPLLDRSGFWRGLERLVSRLTGATARCGAPTTKNTMTTMKRRTQRR